jgi:hypothetical protein
MSRIDKQHGPRSRSSFGEPRFKLRL